MTASAPRHNADCPAEHVEILHRRGAAGGVGDSRLSPPPLVRFSKTYFMCNYETCTNIFNCFNCCCTVTVQSAINVRVLYSRSFDVSGAIKI